VELINSALAEQTEIGWLNLFRGFLSGKWYQLASSYLSTEEGSQEVTNRRDGENRVHRVVKLIYNLTQEIWLGRNEILHDIGKDQEIKRLSMLDSEITKYHSEPDLVLTDDQFYCETSLRRLLTGSTANKRRWLLRVKASRARKTALLHQQPRITKFFTKNTHPGRLRDPSQAHPTSKTNISTQQLITLFYPERDSNHQVSARNKTTQQLITQFLQERASNPTFTENTPSPTPLSKETG
jgi:hypothetical protein